MKNNIYKPLDQLALTLNNRATSFQEKVNAIINTRIQMSDIKRSDADKIKGAYHAIEALLKTIETADDSRHRAQRRLSNLKRYEIAKSERASITYIESELESTVSKDEVLSMINKQIDNRYDAPLPQAVFQGQNGSYMGNMKVLSNGQVDYSNQVGTRITHYFHHQIKGENISITVRIFEPCEPSIDPLNNSPFMEIEISKTIDFESVS